MKYYSYDENMRPVGSGECQLGRDGESLLPVNATFQEPPAANDGYYIAWGGAEWMQIPNPIKSDEQLAAEAREQAKVERQALVDAIKVTVNGKVFDGDEISQGRMARAIIGLQVTNLPSIKWTLADNTETNATLSELTEALVLAGKEQSSIWLI